jgi:1,4-alpha-glucan branching enzyme
MWAHPGKQLLFMGSEFGQGAEWSSERGLDWWVLGDEHHAGVRQLVRDLNQAYRDNPAMWAQDYSPEGFGWIDANDAAGNVLSFLRFAPAPAPGPGGEAAPDDVPAAPGGAETALGGANGQAAAPAPGTGNAPDGPARPATPGVLACIVNFSGGPHQRYQVGLPRAGRWREVVNTDAFVYGGSGVGNLGSIEAVPEPWHGQPASAVLALPPLGALWLVPED